MCAEKLVGHGLDSHPYARGGQYWQYRTSTYWHRYLHTYFGDLLPVIGSNLLPSRTFSLNRGLQDGTAWYRYVPVPVLQYVQ